MQIIRKNTAIGMKIGLEYFLFLKNLLYNFSTCDISTQNLKRDVRSLQRFHLSNEDTATLFKGH